MNSNCFINYSVFVDSLKYLTDSWSWAGNVLFVKEVLPLPGEMFPFWEAGKLFHEQYATISYFMQKAHTAPSVERLIPTIELNKCFHRNTQTSGTCSKLVLKGERYSEFCNTLIANISATMIQTYTNAQNSENYSGTCDLIHSSRSTGLQKSFLSFHSRVTLHTSQNIILLNDIDSCLPCLSWYVNIFMRNLFTNFYPE